MATFIYNVIVVGLDGRDIFFNTLTPTPQPAHLYYITIFERIGKYKHIPLSCARILCRKFDILDFHSFVCASKQKPRNQ